MSLIYIDVRISMYLDEPARVLAICDMQNDTLKIAKYLEYKPPKNIYAGKTDEQIAMMKEIKKSTIIVVDNPHDFRNWNLQFIEKEHLDEAVRAYFQLDVSKALHVGQDLTTYTPKNVIQTKKLDMSGNVYELNSDEVNNKHMAFLVACWAAHRSRRSYVAMTLDEADDQDGEDEDSFFTPFVV